MRSLLFSALLCIATNAMSQINMGGYYSTYDNTVTNYSETRFNGTKPGALKCNFHFWLPQQNRLVLELWHVNQLYHLPNVDSLVQVTAKALYQLSDSLKADGVVRRFDVILNGDKPIIRVVEHKHLPKQYTFVKGDLAQLKMDQDTIRIQFTAGTGLQVKYMDNSGATYKEQLYPGYVMLLVNNVADIQQLPETAVQQCVTRVQQDVKPITKNWSSNAFASYNMKTGQIIAPYKAKYIFSGREQKTLAPNVYVGMQAVRGSFATSVALGYRLGYGNESIKKQYVYAMWEPMFFFSRDASNKLNVDRNDFITLRMSEQDVKHVPFGFTANLSVGYLVGRRGTWFERNTFKFGIPGVRAGQLQLHPEFFFNDFFRNFSPSIKLTLDFD
jgi:hypothetical protein